MSKTDFKKELKHLYQPSPQEIVQVDVPALTFLMVDGKGDPNTSQDYTEAVEALFAVSYTEKFMIKKETPSLDYVVMPLEGLWWAYDMSSFTSNDKSQWSWTMMIMQPPCVKPTIIDAALAAVKKRKAFQALLFCDVKISTRGAVRRRCMILSRLDPAFPVSITRFIYPISAALIPKNGKPLFASLCVREKCEPLVSLAKI